MSNIQPVLPISSTSVSKQMFNQKNLYQQCFSISYPIVKYMITNPQSPYVWKKLIQTCKYFYSKNTVLPVRKLVVESDCSCKADKGFINPFIVIPKIWIYHCFVANRAINLDRLIEKIYKFEIRDMYILQQSLTWNNYQKLTSSHTINTLNLTSTRIRNDDGTVVTLDKLLENLRCLERFEINCLSDSLMFEKDTVKKMVELLTQFNNLHAFNLFGLNKSFDFISFKDFLLTNKSVDVTLCYAETCSSALKEMIHNTVKEIQQNPSLITPHIFFK